MIKQAVITGASSGIGRAIAIELAKQNIHVLALARHKNRLKTLTKQHKNISYIVTDLTKESQYPPIKNHYKKGDTIQYIVICAGTAGTIQPLINCDPDTLRTMNELQIISPILLLQTLHPFLNKTRVLFVGSGSATLPRHNWASYSLGKAGQLMLAHCLKKESAQTSIKVGYKKPGAVDTAIFQEAVNKNKSQFPDQPLYQDYIDNKTVKSPQKAAQELCAHLLTSTEEKFTTF